ncbi:hypothetical protein ACFP81_00900 [Deinococcus lacus]|uniref:Uncharacterized protein n=1 Tax=Deinococcus lacus TaxID=392561 RepID=A0ABW1YCV7_9DEIO
MINPAAALNAPKVSHRFGLRLEGESGAYQPPLDNLGRFTAFLPDGTFRVTAGVDTSGNGIPGEFGEGSASRTAALGPSQPEADIGTLWPE